MNTVPPGASSNINNRITNTACHTFKYPVLFDYSKGKYIYKYVVVIYLIEIYFSTNCWNPYTISITCDTAYYPREKIPVTRELNITKTKRIKNCYRPCPHSEYIP